jgi:GT2 family glycosyltransferase
MSDKVLSIIIPVFNKWNFTKSCLKDLLQLPGNHEIIVIDNDSSDETNVEINKLADEQFRNNPEGCGLAYVRNETNTFHSKACNQGAKIAQGDNILFLNNDIRVKSNHATWTQGLIEQCEYTGSLIGPTMGVLDSNLNFVKEANQQLIGNSYLGGWCIAANRATWHELKIAGTDQIWNEEYPFYFNDTDLSFRARKKNIPLKVISLPEISHFGKVSAAQINVHKLYTEGRSVFMKHWGK